MQLPLPRQDADDIHMGEDTNKGLRPRITQIRTALRRHAPFLNGVANIIWGLIFLLVWMSPTLFGATAVMLLTTFVVLEAICLICLSLVCLMTDRSWQSPYPGERVAHDVVSTIAFAAFLFALYHVLLQVTGSHWTFVGFAALMLRHLWLFRNRYVSEEVKEGVFGVTIGMAFGLFFFAFLAYQLPVPRLSVGPAPFDHTILIVPPEAAHRVLAVGCAYFTCIGAIQALAHNFERANQEPQEIAGEVIQLMDPGQGGAATHQAVRTQRSLDRSS